MQQGDALLFQTTDGGEITVIDGVVSMSGGLDTAAYLSLFGSNEDDDGRQGNELNWWGNIDETDAAFQYRGETQFLLRSIPATSGNLRRVESAVNRDLAWMIEKKVASSVTASAALISANTVKITIKIEAIGAEQSFEFVENWRAET